MSDFVRIFRRLRLVVAGMSLFAFAVIAGCSGGGGDSGSSGQADLGRQTVTASVELPASVPPSSRSVSVVDSLGKSTVDASGHASLPVYGTGGQLATVLSPSGNPMYLGWPTAARPELNARTTAEVLVFFGCGTFLLPTEAQVRTREELAGRSELDVLAAAIASSLDADPDSLSADNPTIRQALTDAVAALEAQAPAGGRVAAGRVLVSPLGSRSGLALNTTSGINSIFFANSYRRPSHCFVDRVSTFDDQGNETPAPASLTDFDIPPVFGLNNTVGTFVDIIWGRMAYEEVQTSPLELPAVKGAAKTRYRVCAVGPGSQDGDLSQLKAGELNEQKFVTQVFVTRDLFLPMVLNLLIPNSSLDDAMKFIGGADVVGDFISAIGQNVPGIWEKASAGDIKGAFGDAYNALVGNSTFRNIVCQKLLDRIRNNAGWEVAEAAASNAQRLLNAMKVVDTLLQSFDTMGIGYAIGQSDRADIWTVDVTEPEVLLTPATSKIHNDATVDFTVTVPEASLSGVDLVYRWTNSAGVGHLADGLAGHRDSFDSTRSQTTYKANSTGTGTDTVRVDVYMLSGAGQHDRTLVGSATATVEVEVSHDYVLAGSASGISSFVVDDDLDVYVNGTLVYTDGSNLSGYRWPIAIEASRGDAVRLVVRDTYGFCSSLGAVYLVQGATSQKLSDGFNLGCGRPGGDQGVVFDQTFTVPF